MAVAIHLHRDVCLMTTNLDILDLNALSLQGEASKMLETSIGYSDYLRRTWRRGLWVLRSATLPFRWRLWDYGAPRWILSVSSRILLDYSTSTGYDS